jgi:hypothetical protein
MRHNNHIELSNLLPFHRHRKPLQVTQSSIHFLWIHLQLHVVFFSGVGWDWVHLVRRPLTGPLYQTRIIDECGEFGGTRTGKETRVLGGNLPHCHFVHLKSHITWPIIEPGPPATNCLSCDATSQFDVNKWHGKIKYTHHLTEGARGSVVGWGTMLQAGRSRDGIPMW